MHVPTIMCSLEDWLVTEMRRLQIQAAEITFPQMMSGLTLEIG